MRDELQTAHDMQMDLLPKGNPDLVGYSLDGVCIPANNVGGDYYAYRWLDEGDSRLALVVAEVSGKAMEGAITALRFNEMLRYETRNRKDPAPILEGFKDSLDGQIETSTFITCLCCRTGHEHRVSGSGKCRTLFTLPLTYMRSRGWFWQRSPDSRWVCRL